MLACALYCSKEPGTAPNLRGALGENGQSFPDRLIPRLSRKVNQSARP